MAPLFLFVEMLVSRRGAGSADRVEGALLGAAGGWNGGGVFLAGVGVFFEEFEELAGSGHEFAFYRYFAFGFFFFFFFFKRFFLRRDFFVLLFGFGPFVESWIVGRFGVQGRSHTRRATAIVEDKQPRSELLVDLRLGVSVGAVDRRTVGEGRKRFGIERTESPYVMRVFSSFVFYCEERV